MRRIASLIALSLLLGSVPALADPLPPPPERPKKDKQKKDKGKKDKGKGEGDTLKPKS